jgi:hypothetical protein
MIAKTVWKSILCVLILGFSLGAFLLLGSAVAMERMSEAEMKKVSAGSFSEFTVQQDQARMWLNVHAEIWADADSFQAGYHDGGWDQHWQGVTIGSQDTPMQMDGFVIQAQFDNIDSDSRKLQTFSMGFESATGTLTADNFTSFSGTVSSGRYRRTGSIDGITFDGDPFKMVIDTGTKYESPGIYMDFGEARASGVN